MQRHKNKKKLAVVKVLLLIYNEKDSKESSVTVHEVNSNEFIGKTGGKP